MWFPELADSQLMDFEISFAFTVFGTFVGQT